MSSFHLSIGTFSPVYGNYLLFASVSMFFWDHCGCVHKVVGFITTYMQSVPITNNIVTLNPAQARCRVLDTTLFDKVCQ